MDRQLRDANRDLALTLLKRRKNEQYRCRHAKGGSLSLATDTDTAFCFLKLCTGEIVGTCLYCQKIISSIDPRDKEIFHNAFMKSTNTMAEMGQLLEGEKYEDKLFKQLARQTPDEKEQILKAHIAGYREEKQKEPPKACYDSNQISEEELRAMPLEELEKIAKLEYKKIRKKYR